MNTKPFLVALLALLATIPLAPTAAANECVPTGTSSAPPCLAAGVPTQACNVNTAACLTFYVFLIPDYDGNLQNGLDFDARIVWQETNGCPGLQRSAGSCPAGRDKPLNP